MIAVSPCPWISTRALGSRYPTRLRVYRGTVASVAIALLLLCGQARADDSSVIEGGRRVGSYELGRKFSLYSRLLGPPTRVQQSDASGHTRLIYYKKFGMYFFVRRDVVNGIQVESPLFSTTEGIHVGSVREDVLRAYGVPQSLRSEDVIYPEFGLGFNFRQGRVVRILVVDREERDLASGDRRIVPGVRVGGIQIGQSVEFVLRQWKNPSRQAPFPNKAGYRLWSYPKKGVVIVESSGRVDGIWIFSPEFHTAGDIHVGSRRGEVVRAYGTPRTREDNLESYPDSGVGFFYEKGVVKQIYVKESSGRT